MTKSSMAPTLLLALTAAQPLGAEEAIAAQRAELRAALRLDCPAGEDGDVVVCARGANPARSYRVPPSAEPGRIERVAGEAPGGMEAMNAAPSRCTTVGRDRSCGGVDFLGAGIALLRAVVEGIERRHD